MDKWGKQLTGGDEEPLRIFKLSVKYDNFKEFNGKYGGIRSLFGMLHASDECEDHELVQIVAYSKEPVVYDLIQKWPIGEVVIVKGRYKKSLTEYRSKVILKEIYLDSSAPKAPSSEGFPF